MGFQKPLFSIYALLLIYDTMPYSTSFYGFIVFMQTYPELYLISPETINDITTFRQHLPDVLNLSGASCFQVRLPHLSHDERLHICKDLCPIVQNQDVAFIVADDIECARACHADGVHLETPLHDTNTITAQQVKSAKQKLGTDSIVGVSSGNCGDTALACAEAGADYVSFGPVFESSTKPNLKPINTALLTWWSQMTTVPCVAIGGMTPQTIPQCPPTDFVAVLGGLWNGEVLTNATQLAQITTAKS